MSINSHRASCVPEQSAYGTPAQQAPQSATTERKAVRFDVLDISRVIDIYCESRAVEEFDAEMRKERK
jgi:hypothetical protein